jgi:2-dehydropantoate 2-reductase
LLIFGTGALACIFGARLARTGTPVTLVGTWHAALERIAADGVSVEDGSGTWSERVGVRHRGDELPRGEPVLVLVKSFQTASVAHAAARPGGLILTLQNGLGNRETLNAAAPERVALGVATMGVTLLAPGRVRDGGPGRVALGDDLPRLGDDLDAAAARLGAAFPVERHADVERLVWRKLAVNCAINGPAALLGVANGGLLEAAERRTLLERTAREVAAVAEARGTPIDTDPAALAVGVATQTATNRCSMLQDLDRGAPTEVEAIYGALVREAARLAVPVPENERLYAALLRRERSGVPA